MTCTRMRPSMTPFTKTWKTQKLWSLFNRRSLPRDESPCSNPTDCVRSEESAGLCFHTTSQRHRRERLGAVKSHSRTWKAPHIIGIISGHRDRIHEKLAVIDDKVFWEGSLNILSHNQSNERMNRWSNSRALREALISHKLDSCGDCRKRGSMKQFSRDSECDFEHRRMVADITNRRIELGLSQRQLAMMVGVSRLTICHFESGKYDIRLWTLLKICESLDFKLKALSWHDIPALNDILDSDSKLCSPMRNTSTKR